ncbi:MAG: hypothetical protein LBQ46_02655 [Treponema sp.]|jgi:hypothetical protein|nr:hypothetical protein [Treponema sp.]
MGNFGASCNLTLFLTVLLLLGGCEPFNNSMVDYFLDHTGPVEVTGAAGKTETAVMPNGTILIPYIPPPGTTTVIGLGLYNPRSLNVLQTLSNADGNAAVGTLVTRQTASGEIELVITGAAEWEDYLLTLVLQSPDGLRDFEPYVLNLKCVSFDTALQDFAVDAVHPSFIPNQQGFLVKVPYDTAAVTLTGVTLHTSAVLAIHAGTDDSTSPLAGAVHTAAVPVSLNLGNNHFYLKVTNVQTQGYPVTVFRGAEYAKVLTEFYFELGPKKYGAGAGTEPGSGIIDQAAHTVAVTVPYGTSAAGLVPTINHTGLSISPAPGAAWAPLYTITAPDGSTQAYTVTVTVQGQGTVVFTFTGPADETITLTGDQILYWKADTPLSLSVSGSYTSYQWYLDGNPLAGETNPTLTTLTARDFSLGTHNLSVRVEKNGSYYSKELTITVEPGF